MLPERKREAHLPDDHEHDIYDTRFYQLPPRWVGWCVDRRYLVLGGTVLVFIVSMAGFSLIPKQFFPSSDRPELLMDVRLQEGASFAPRCARSSAWKGLDGRPEIEHMVSFVGSGALLPAAGPAAGHAQLRPVRHHRAFGGRPRSWRNGSAPCCARNSAPCARAVTPGERPPVGFPVQFRISGDKIATVRATARSPRRSAPTPAPSTCSSTGTSRPSARCASRSTSRRRAKSASRPATCPASWP